MNKQLQIIVIFLLGLVSLEGYTQVTANFSADTIIGCSPLTVQFEDLSTGSITSWSWDFGNSNSSSEQNPEENFFIPGDYTVSLTVSDGSNSDTKTKTAFIRVFDKPNPAFTTSSGSTGCTPFDVSLQDLSTPSDTSIASWLWDFGDGYVSTDQAPSHAYVLVGSFNVSLTIIDAIGCDSTISQPALFTTIQSPTADFPETPFSSCTPPLDVAFTNSSSGSGLLNYEWTFGDGYTSSAFEPSHTYVDFGAYDVTLNVSSDNGCSDELTRENHVAIADVVASFDTPQNKQCPGIAFQFFNTSVGGNEYSWNFGDGNTSTVYQPTHTYLNPGTYNVTLQVSVQGESCSDTYSHNVIVEDINASFTNDPSFSCSEPLSVNYTCTTPNADEWYWIFGDGETSTQENPTHTFYLPGNATNGSYKFSDTLRVVSQYGCEDIIAVTDNVEITTLHSSTGGFNASPLSGCAPLDCEMDSDNIHFDTSNDSIVSWSWNFGDGNSDNINPVTNTYNNTGTYEATLTVITATGCSETFETEVRVGDQPNADFIVHTPISCAFDTVVMQDNSSGASNIDYLHWIFSDQTHAYSPLNSSYGYAYHFLDTGYLSVTYIVGDRGCMDSIVKDSAVYIQGPVSAITDISDHNCADPLTYSFTSDLLDADKWKWDFGDGTIDSVSLLTTASHTYSEKGLYKIALTSSNTTNGCYYTDTVTVNPTIPEAHFTLSNSVTCKWYNITFDASASVDNISDYHNWFFGDGVIFYDTAIFEPPEPLVEVQHYYNSTGTFYPSLVVKDRYGCYDTLTQKVDIYKPDAGFTADITSGCSPITVNFSDTSLSDTALNKFIWYVGTEIFAQGEQNPTLEFTEPGIYDIRLYIEDVVGCFHSEIKNSYIVASQPLTEFRALDSIVCIGDSVHFEAEAGSSYQWSFGDGENSIAINPAHYYSDTGYFDVTLTTTDTLGCDSTLTIDSMILIQPMPVANFVTDTIFAECYPLLVNFTDSSNYPYQLDYWWEFGDGAVSNFQNPSHNYIEPGLFNVKMIINTQGGCTDTLIVDSLIELHGAYAKANVNPDTICLGDTVMYTMANKLDVEGFKWFFGDGIIDSSSIDTIYHVLNQPGWIFPSVNYWDSVHACPDRTSWDSIYVYEVISDFNTPDTAYCTDLDIPFTNLSNTGDSWQWDFDDGNSSTDEHPDHFYSNPGTYSVSLITDIDFGCSDTINKSILIYDRPVITLSNDTTICHLDTVFLEATGTDNYLWSPGFYLDNSLISNPQSIPDTTIKYIVIYTNDDFICDLTDSVEITILPLPVTSIRSDTTICNGDSINYFAPAGYPEYLWSTGANTDNIWHKTADTLWNKILGINGCWSLPDTAVLDIFALPNTSLGNDTIICYGDTTTFDAGSEFISYTWHNGETSQIISAYQEDTIWVEVQDTNTCRNYSDTVVLSIQSLPVLTLRADTSICNRDTLILDAGAIYNGYNWSTGDTTSSISITTSQLITATVFDNLGCESLVDSFNLVVHPLPVIDIGNDTSICLRDTIYFDAGTGFIQYEWQDGSNSQGLELIPSVSLNVFAFVQDTNQCWSDTSTLFLTVDTLPAAFAGFDTIICTEDSLLLDPGGVYDAYLWNDGSTNINYTIHGNDTAFVSVMNSFGCWSDSDTIVVEKHPVYTAVVRSDTTVCEMDSLLLNIEGPFNSYSWNNGATDQSLYFIPQHNDTVISSAIDTNTCIAKQDTLILDIYDLPQIDLGNDTSICDEELLVLAVESGYVTYIWSNGDNDHQTFVTEADTILLKVQDGNTCWSLEDTIIIDIDTLPAANVGNDTIICFGDSLILDAGNYEGYWWSDFTSDEYLTLNSADTVQVRVMNSFGCWSHKDTFRLGIYELPVIQLPEDTSICYGDSTTITLSDEFINYFWSTGDTTNAVVVHINNNILVTAYVQDSNACFSHPNSVSYTNLDLPVIDLGPDFHFCNNDTFYIEVDTIYQQYFWSNGDTTHQTQFTEGGSVSLIVQSYEGCYSIPDSVSFTIDPLPVISLGNDTTICPTDTITLKLDTTFSWYFWSDNSTSDSLLISETDTVSLYVIDSNDCYSNTTTIIINEFERPVSQIDLVDEELCFGDSLSLSAVEEFSSYYWSTGDSASSILIYPDNDTIITLVVWDEHNCYSQEDTSTVTVHPLPITLLEDSILICPWDTIYLDPGTGYNEYIWSTGETGEVLLVNFADTVLLNVVDTNSCLSLTDTSIIYFDTIPEIIFNLDTTSCTGDSIIIETDYAFSNYLWSDGSSDSIYIVRDNDSIWLIAYTVGNCWSYSDTATVFYNTLPPPIELPDTISCYGTTAMIDAGEFNGYLWSDSSSNRVFELEFLVTGSVGVRIQDSNLCWSPESTFDYTVIPAPIINLEDTLIKCPYDSIQMNSPDGFVSYQWSTGDTTQSIEVFNPGSYIGSVYNGTCWNSDTIILTDVDIVVDLGIDTFLCDGEELMLDVENENAEYYWSTGETSSFITIYPWVKPYWVQVTKENCVIVDSININKCPEWPDNVVEVPNAFSPNGDGLNDKLRVLGYDVASIEYMIFNRFGELIYQTANVNEAFYKGWDGSYNGEVQETDVFVYLIYVEFNDGTKETVTGNVTLLR
jgi:gliding motility-associated-like protein